MQAIHNDKWGKTNKPFMTVITPVYNRRATIERTIESVDKQTFRDIEYIIIDDGSTESIDDIVERFMDSTDLPVMFVKKQNGGVHTAGNVGYENARGELVLCVDSDDELVPDACEVFYRTWLSIPKEIRKKCWQMKAQDVDQNGKIAGTKFPSNINEMSINKARKYFSLAKGDQIGCRLVKIMKKNKFPEPDGVTFVPESIKWAQLELKYRSWGLNDVLLICHREGSDHLYNKFKGKKAKQDFRNKIWSIAYRANSPRIYRLGFIKRLKFILGYCVLGHILISIGDREFVQKYTLSGLYNNFWKIIFWVPAGIVANFYYKKNIRH